MEWQSFETIACEAWQLGKTTIYSGFGAQLTSIVGHLTNMDGLLEGFGTTMQIYSTHMANNARHM